MLGLVLVIVTAVSVTLPADDAASAAAPERVRLGGVSVDLRPGTRQVVTVNHRSEQQARVAFWEKRDGRWERQFSASDGRIGYGGLVTAREREQGTGATPLGTFGIPFAFGQHPKRSAWDVPYRRIRSGDYWVQDNDSRFYNRYRSKDAGGFRWWLPTSADNSSEHLVDFGDQYEWAIVMDFNWGQVPERGSGIFLHVNGDGPTSGCVSAPRSFIRRVMERLDAARVPVVAVGR